MPYNPIALLLIVMIIGGYLVSTVIAYKNFPDEEDKKKWTYQQKKIH